MIIKSAEFVTSSTHPDQYPKTRKPEFAFIGRSNVGKSSLINMLAESKALAKISSKPGKTQLVNHFLINDEWMLVDLPGYGYAKAAKSDREKFAEVITRYIVYRENLFCLMVLIDSRISPQEIDLEFINWLGEHQIPFVIIFTKSDKNKPAEQEKNISDFRNQMLQTWEELPEMFITSATEKTGREEVLGFIGRVISKK